MKAAESSRLVRVQHPTRIVDDHPESYRLPQLHDGLVPRDRRRVFAVVGRSSFELLRNFGGTLADRRITVMLRHSKHRSAVIGLDEPRENELIHDADPPELNSGVGVPEKIRDPRQCSRVCDDAQQFHRAAAHRNVVLRRRK